MYARTTGHPHLTYDVMEWGRGEFSCFLHVCVGFLRVFQLPPICFGYLAKSLGITRILRNVTLVYL